MTTTASVISNRAVAGAMASNRTSFSQANSTPGVHVHHMHFKSLVAGLSAGVTSTLILHPLDLVKIRFQVNEGHKVMQRPKYGGIVSAFSSIIRERGIRGLYQGVAPNVWGTGASWGVYFLCYNGCKSWLQGDDKQVEVKASTHLLAAGQAGIMSLLLTNPILVAKTRLCLQYKVGTDSIYYSGMTDCLQKMYRLEGVKGLYKGFVPGLFGISHGSIQFVAYEELKKRYNSYRQVPSSTKLNSTEYVLFAAVSKFVASSVTYPYQVLRSRLQDQHCAYSGVNDVIKSTYRMEGLRGFYRGFVPYLCHVTPNICIVFLVYETITNYDW